MSGRTGCLQLIAVFLYWFFDGWGRQHLAADVVVVFVLFWLLTDLEHHDFMISSRSGLMRSSWTLCPFVPVMSSFCLVCAKLLICACVPWLEFPFWSLWTETDCHPISAVAELYWVMWVCCMFLEFCSQFPSAEWCENRQHNGIKELNEWQKDA